MKEQRGWSSKFVVVVGFIWTLILLAAVATFYFTGEKSLLDNPVFMIVLSILMMLLGLHMLIANRFWLGRYSNSIGSWGIHLSQKMIFGIVIFSGVVVIVSGIALAVKALMTLAK